MSTARIAHIVATDADRATLSPRVYDIPPEIIGHGFAVDNVSVLRGAAMVNEVDRTLSELTFVEAGLRAEAAGYAAILITPPLDYGVRMLRANVRIPVIGGGQAAMQLATTLGRRFAIVTVWPSVLRSSYERVIAESGFTALCTGVRFVTEDQELASLLGPQGLIRKMGTTHDVSILDRIERAARAAVSDGADAIVLGCTCMTPIHEELEARLEGIPVIDPLKTGYKYAEMAVSLGAVQRQGAPSMHASELRAMIEQLGGRSANVCEDECPVVSGTPEVVREKGFA